MSMVELVISIAGILLALRPFLQKENDRTLLQVLVTLVIFLIVLVAWSLDLNL